MKNIDYKSIGCIALKVFWRIALAAACIAIVASIGMDMAYKAIFHGPSVSARDALVLTLLESKSHKNIPAKYLGEDVVEAILAERTGSMGTGNPSLIQPGTATGTESDVTVEGGTYTATVSFFTDPSQITVSQTGDQYLCITNGVLQLSDTDDLGGRCEAILILDGNCNEHLLGGSCGYAPYVALGQKADGTFILVTTDGWTTKHPGATYQDLINIMTKYGAVNACVVGISEE